jgi:hypothetical protein
MVETAWTRFAGANIKGNPSMSAAKVKGDIELLRRNCTVMVLQEFRWPWYWGSITQTLRENLAPARRWRTAPGMARGKAKPVYAAQAIAWHNGRWKRTERVRQYLLHKGVAQVSEARYLRAALLAEQETGMECWFGTTHNVVGGDAAGDSARRKAILGQDIERLHALLRELKKTGHPVVFQGDFNIHRDTWAYKDLMWMLKGMRARVIGEHGVEYLFVIDAHSDVKVEVAKDWVILPKRLNTDHEVRGMTFRLVRP